MSGQGGQVTFKQIMATGSHAKSRGRAFQAEGIADEKMNTKRQLRLERIGPGEEL